MEYGCRGHIGVAHWDAISAGCVGTLGRDFCWMSGHAAMGYGWRGVCQWNAQRPHTGQSKGMQACPRMAPPIRASSAGPVQKYRWQ